VLVPPLNLSQKGVHMPDLARILIHPSQFPDQVREDLLDSLRNRRINHKFHYDSFKQARQWLALHEAFSPARTDPDCLRAYSGAFARAVAELDGSPVHLVGLGCGGGQKEADLLRVLSQAGVDVFYTPVDVSTALTLTARQAALQWIPDPACSPLVCDLSNTADLAQALRLAGPPQGIARRRLVTFFGMLPNFEPSAVPGLLEGVLDSGDAILVSANLAPGADYAEGAQRVLPLYDNPLTREWLLTFLLDLGLHRNDGTISFSIEDVASTPLKRIVANFHFLRACRLSVGSDEFKFVPGEVLRLFFSCRHTLEGVKQLLEGCRIALLDRWINASGEEGVFLGRRK